MTLAQSSLLPKVYNVDIPDWGPCSILALEAMRLAAVIVTVLHLLALAVNHYIGIARPLHYAGTWSSLVLRSSSLAVSLSNVGHYPAISIKDAVRQSLTLHEVQSFGHVATVPKEYFES